ncbi:MAG: hypothetical protein HY754_08330 [Nitrospirae bacterium]|nr:hypothetical protein [Nitrospirota bacterium]
MVKAVYSIFAHYILPFLILFFLILRCTSYAFMSENEILTFQKKIADKPVGERIALWAEKFVGSPYDPDPMGEYVTKNVIVADERVDCMYLSFRTVELAMGLTPEQAVNIALDTRFISKGRLDEKGNVLNYEDRFQYGEDMLDSGKWGREITSDLGKITEIKGARGRDKVKMISKETLLKSIKGSKYQRVKGSDTMTLWRSDTLKNGDLIFFIKAVEKRKVGEIVGHIGIVKIECKMQNVKCKINDIEQKEIYLIHASGVKNKGGEVKKVRLYEYIKSMPFIGIRVGRFD